MIKYQLKFPQKIVSQGSRQSILRCCSFIWKKNRDSFDLPTPSFRGIMTVFIASSLKIFNFTENNFFYISAVQLQETLEFFCDFFLDFQNSYEKIII